MTTHGHAAGPPRCKKIAVNLIMRPQARGRSSTLSRLAQRCSEYSLDVEVKTGRGCLLATPTVMLLRQAFCTARVASRVHVCLLSWLSIRHVHPGYAVD